MALILPNNKRKNNNNNATSRSRLLRRHGSSSRTASCCSCCSNKHMDGCPAVSLGCVAVVVLTTILAIYSCLVLWAVAITMVDATILRAALTADWTVAAASGNNKNDIDIRTTTLRRPLVSQQQGRELPQLHAQAQSLTPTPTLDQEMIFRGTLKSCLPSSNPKCKLYIPPPTTTTTTKHSNPQQQQRIALMAPPGPVADAVGNLVQTLARAHNDNSGGSNTASNNPSFRIQIIPTTHVPPYGYGKTHGLTKIIRLAPFETLSSLSSSSSSSSMLLLDTTQALLQLKQQQPQEQQQQLDHFDSTTAATMITTNDVGVATQQIVRFHCRLSHVAAHTSLLTLNVAQLLLALSTLSSNNNNKNTKELEKLWSFLTANEKERSGNNPLPAPILEQVQPLLTAVQNAVVNVQRQGSQLLADLTTTNKDQSIDSTAKNGNANNNNNNHQLLWNQVLRDELTLSKNLTVWPCPSFWGPFSQQAQQQTNSLQAKQFTSTTKRPLSSPLAAALARALSPNCSDPMASCWVERDRCEARGDAVCAKSKASK